MDYIGEHLLPGKIGQLLLYISLIASLLAAFAYWRSFKTNEVQLQKQWKKLGRIAFIADAVAVIGIFILLYILIRQHRFEYYYVFKNSGKDLEPKYIFSSIWSASEGSFLLWAIWHGVLGTLLIFTSRKWEGPVMAVLSFLQFCLSSMMAGLYLFNWKMGATPFALFREVKGELPLFTNPNYLSNIKDGNGLNQLLQNYWMVIHPPVLFLGFASVAIPFAYAISGLLTRKHKEWLAPALPWSLFSAAALGVGIMMGAAWAYESLSFGGYWAWDPVENASLVPWMILISGIHTLLIFKHTGRSLSTTYLFFILSFLFIVYSTFLTRSGILGETSVHSFADLGMNFQLLLFLLIFTIPSLALYFVRLKEIPKIQKEEEISSREFWMYIGALVFFFAAMVIIGKTSVPVYNKIFGQNIAPPEEVEYSYNSIMIWVAIIIGTLTAIIQYLKYKKTTRSFLIKKLVVPTIISAIIATLVLSFGNINFAKYGMGYLTAIWMAVVASIYTIIANAAYIWLGFKGKLKISGPSIAHLGFGMMLLGMLISASKKEVISHNINGIGAPLGEGENPMENLTLIKGVPVTMDKFQVTYLADSVHPKKPLWYYSLQFIAKDSSEKFTLKPNAFINYQNNEGLMANPDSKHYWNKDIFTYITSLPDPSAPPDTTGYQSKTLKTGDSIFFSNGYMILNGLQWQTSDLPAELFGANGKLAEAAVKVFSIDSTTYTSTLRLAFAKDNKIGVADTLHSQGLILKLSDATDNNVTVEFKETKGLLPYVTLKAYIFPYINLVWLGTLLMTCGFIISMVHRAKQAKNTSA